MKKLTLVDKAFFLKNTPLFRVLDLDLLLPIADKLGLAQFEADAHIFHVGDEAHLIYFIFEGEVEIVESALCLAQSDFFGDEALFSGEARSYSVRAKTEVKALTLSRTHLMRIIAECPSVALGFLQVYTKTHPFMKQAHELPK